MAPLFSFLRMTAITFVAMALSVGSLTGCTQKRTYSGLVFSKEKTGLYSLATLRVGMELQKEENPVEGASVFLAEDAMGLLPLKGYSATTDANGRYVMNTQWPPPGHSFSDVLYFIVRKNGYEDCVFQSNSNQLSANREICVELLRPVK